MRSVVVTWTEVSSHCVVVNVPAEFDPEVVEWGDALGGLEYDGFLGVVRVGMVVRFVDAPDPAAEMLLGLMGWGPGRVWRSGPLLCRWGGAVVWVCP